MAAHPQPFDGMPLCELIELFPQIVIFYRFLVGGAPIALFPGMYPFADALLHILGIGVQAAFRMAVSALQVHELPRAVPCGYWSSVSRHRTIRACCRCIAAARPSRRCPGLPLQAPSVNISTTRVLLILTRGPAVLSLLALRACCRPPWSVSGRAVPRPDLCGLGAVCANGAIASPGGSYLFPFRLDYTHSMNAFDRREEIYPAGKRPPSITRRLHEMNRFNHFSWLNGGV